jgi:predicted enzyme related to lactoylglutathione lyase
MGRRVRYAPGTFAWVDLATTDVTGAKSFYTALFGWEADDGDDATGRGYTTFRRDGDAVCGLFPMSDQARAAGRPPGWTSHVSVAEADATARRARELGGRVIDGAVDVMDLGRMAVLGDPQGASFAVWEPGTRIGAERVNDVGCLCMNELVTSDLDAARAFYEGLFGWRTEPIDTGPEGPPMVAVYNGESLNASLGVASGGPPQWRPYFTVESTEATLERAHELGGEGGFGPVPIPDGSIAGVVDPQGALFALFEGEVDP